MGQAKTGPEFRPRSAAAEPLEGRKAAVVTHVYATGPAHALVDYIRARAAELTVIEHAFSFAPRSGSVETRYVRGRRTRATRFPWPRGMPEPITWAKDFWLTVLWGLRRAEGFDLLVATNCLLGAAGLLLRSAGKVRRVVLWTIDYTPQRFENPLFNFVYHRLDRLCVAHCDETWNVSPRIEPARRTRGVRGPQRLVPVGANPIVPSGAVEHRRLVFLGHLLEKQGVQLVLDAMPLLRRQIPSARLLVIGDGPYRGVLERKAAELGLDGVVSFTGFVEDHAIIERMLAESGVAVAPYRPDSASFSLYADPGKIKNYLAAGLPVVTTEVPHLARLLEERGCGVVVEYDTAALVTGLLEILGDRERHDEYRAKARALGSEFHWDKIFERALQPLWATSAENGG
jgi:glycosyltransferase involved in cell wall biosynthesis